ncbi:MAG: DUF6125 family protein [Promethearchaeota archaeon]
MLVNDLENKSSKNLIKEKYEISLKTQKFILQMCWAQHDGQWFLKSKRRFGIETANNLNKEVIRSMGRIEARHILNALGIHKGDIKSIPQLFKIFNTFMEVLIPKVMKFKFFTKSENEGFAIVEKCFIWKEVQKSKKEGEYVCACNSRHRGWLEAIDINGEIIAEKRISKGDNICKFCFKIS